MYSNRYCKEKHMTTILFKYDQCKTSVQFIKKYVHENNVLNPIMQQVCAFVLKLGTDIT